MKKPFRMQLEARKNRLKRHSGDVLREVGTAFLLLGAIAAAAVTLVIGYDLILRSPLLGIRETVVKGCQELTEKEVLALAAVRPAANLLTINQDAVVRRIRSNPWVRNVFVGREFPGRLVIAVRERKPVALIDRGEGLLLVDEEGSLFKKLEAGEESDLPVLTGCVRSGTVNEALVKKSLALLNELAAIQNGPDIGKVSEINGDETFGLSLFADSGLCLQLGFDAYENKLRRLNTVMADLDRKNLKRGYLMIDLSNPEKINVQKRNIPEPAEPETPAVAGKEFRL
jgi:cell division protein FtsQ